MTDALSRLPPATAFAPDEYPRPYVHDHDGRRSLHFSISAVQSRVNLQHPSRLDLEYTRLMAAFLWLQPAPQDIGLVGLGGGSLARFCHDQVPTSRLWVAEINPHVIALREVFGVPDDSARLRVLQVDGAAFVRCLDAQLDVLLIDGYNSEGLPRSLASQRFFDHCASALRPGGVLVMNLWAEPARKAQVLGRIRRSFGGVLLEVHDSERFNTVVFATRGPGLQSVRRSPLRRPPGLDDAVWAHLQSAFGQVLSAWVEAFA